MANDVLCRRAVLLAGAAVLAGPHVARADDSENEDPARRERPQAGDLFVHADGPHEGQPIAAADLVRDAAPLLAWPYDPEKKLPRDGSRLNQVLLLRVDPAALEDAERAHAADGVLAFSAICTHAQCTVSDWRADRKVLHCPCHDSEYDPRQNCAVVFGPAPRPLAALPVAISDGMVRAAGGFLGRVGMRPTG